jgi:hypothetical protein
MDVVVREGAAPPAQVTGQVCIGCLALEAPAPCVGRCDDRRISLVRAADVERVALMDRWAGTVAAALEPVAGRIAALDVRAVEPAYRALQHEVRGVLHELPAAPLVGEAAPVPETIEAWWCATCGRVEALRPCLGVCIRRPETLAREQEHAQARSAAEAARSRASELLALAREVAWVTPRPGHWAPAGAALAARARRLLAA